MTSKLTAIVENGELNDIIDLDVAKMIVSEAMLEEKRKPSGRKFLYELSQCETVERVQSLTFNAYLKHNGMAVLK